MDAIDQTGSGLAQCRTHTKLERRFDWIRYCEKQGLEPAREGGTSDWFDFEHSHLFMWFSTAFSSKHFDMAQGRHVSCLAPSRLVNALSVGPAATQKITESGRGPGEVGS